MSKMTDELMEAMYHLHKGLHIFKKTFHSLPEAVKEKHGSTHNDIIFDTNANAGLIGDIVIDLLK
ncbi:MAG: hypothetical protein IJ271_05585 [Bacteroidales bacterium]|nr:hypothetical protein [Bacteroidales bacterium]MBQ8049108.1 hypothetical protein [Bacteroidales bacterium]